MRFSCLVLLLSICCSCSNPKNRRINLIDFAPKDTELLITCHSIEGLQTTIKDNPFLSLLTKNTVLQKISAPSAPLHLLNFNQNALLCFSKDKSDRISYSFISKYSERLFLKDSLKNYSEETLKYSNKTIIKSKLNTDVFYSTVIDSIFFLTSSKSTIDALFNTKETPSSLKQFYSTLDHSSALSVILKSQSTLLSSPASNELQNNTTALSEYIALDTEITPDNITITGIAKSTDSIHRTLDLFKNTTPQNNQLQHITPSNADGYLSISFNAFSVFYNNLNHSTVKDSLNTPKTLCHDVKEIGLIFEDNTPAVVLNSSDVIATDDALLDEKNIITSYRTIPIFNFSKTQIFSKLLQPFTTDATVSKYCIIDHFFIFAKTTTQLEQIISSYQNKTVFGQLSDFKALSKNLSTESSLLLIGTPKILEQTSLKNFTFQHNSALKSYNILGLQFIHDNAFAHVNGSLLQTKKKYEHSISEAFNITLDAPLANTPQFVKNHSTKQKDIVVQDTNNVLYLISNTGKIIWNKTLEAPIIGDISQIDMYKNGRLQLAFTTANKLYVLDRKGRDVSPYPLPFNTEITQPLSVFDYDNNRTYRLLVTQGKTISMYDARGAKVKGFTFKNTNTPLNTAPKHFRIGTKDYIVLKTKQKLYILDRVGRIRVTPKTTPTYANTPVFLYQNKFATTTASGRFITIDTKGNTAEVNLNLSANHHLETTNKTRVTFHDNKLSIKNRNLDLDYGTYSPPKIFYINSKIYVAITNLDSKKLYVFDSLGQLRPNFPVFGNSAIDLDNIDADRNLELVTKGNDDSIILYQIN